VPLEYGSNTATSAVCTRNTSSIRPSGNPTAGAAGAAPWCRGSCSAGNASVPRRRLFAAGRGRSPMGGSRTFPADGRSRSRDAWPRGRAGTARGGSSRLRRRGDCARPTRNVVTGISRIAPGRSRNGKTRRVRHTVEIVSDRVNAGAVDVSDFLHHVERPEVALADRVAGSAVADDFDSGDALENAPGAQQVLAQLAPCRTRGCARGRSRDSRARGPRPRSGARAVGGVRQPSRARRTSPWHPARRKGRGRGWCCPRPGRECSPTARGGCSIRTPQPGSSPRRRPSAH